MLLITLCIATVSYARDIMVIVNPPGIKVTSGTCILYGAHNDSVGSVRINDNGILSLPDSGFAKIMVDAEDCSPRLIEISVHSSDTIVLKPVSLLSEVVITPENVKDLGDRLSYHIPMSDMNRYPNFYQALNEIPHLTVLPSGGAFYEGGSDVKFLINGVETTRAELQTISKEDISRIELYRNPPARFAAQGIATVVDVRTKSKIHGGNFGMDVDQAFYPLKGYNSAAFYYNYRQSRFSLLYSGGNAHYDKYRQNEILSYRHDGVDYEKIKRGLDSKSDEDNNNLSLSFQNNREGSYLYNLQAGAAWNRLNENVRQSVTSNLGEYDAQNFLKSNYNKYNVANYFEKQLGENKRYGVILGNLNYQHFDTKYASSYREFSNDGKSDAMDSHSAYKTNLDGVFGELQYELPKNKAGYLSLAVFDSYKHNSYVDAVTPFYKTTNTLGMNATWIGSWKQLRWYAVMGVSAYHISTSLLEKPYDMVLPSPRLQLTWRPRWAFQLIGGYSYTGSVPSIAQLSETEQWLDTRLVYHGNSLLSPYKEHSLYLQGNFNNRYAYASLRLGYINSPDMICSQYTATDRYMLETVVNLDRYEALTGQFDMTICPLGNNKLTFWNRVILAEVNGKNPQYSWKGHRFQWMSQLALNLDKWSFSAFYQYPGKIADGQLIRPRAECWYVMAYFRPMPNLSVGLKWFMPFGKGFRESEYTVKDAPVYAETGCDIRDGANYVSLLFPGTSHSVGIRTGHVRNSPMAITIRVCCINDGQVSLGQTA